MKKTSLLILIVFLSLATSSHASQFVSSKISEVTLFSDQALVNREGLVDVKPGLNEMLLEITAFVVDKDSVTARIYGDGEIISVQIKDIPLAEFPQERVNVLENKIKDLKRSRKALVGKKDVLQKKESFLNALTDFSKTQIPKDVQTSFPKIEDIKNTLIFLGAESDAINNETQTIDNNLEDMDREIKRLEKELNAARGYAQQSKKVVEVLFNAKRQESVRMDIQYLVKNAFWRPQYKVSVPNDLSVIDLTMFSRISQKSGEDWKNIKLSVSNVIPLKGIRLPEPSSWMLDIPRPPRPMVQQKSRRPLGVASMEAALDEEVEMTGAEAPVAYATAVQKELPLSFEYEIPFPVSIESREKFSLLPLFTKKISADYFHYCIPQKTGLTFLVAEASADKELLGGQLDVYFGGRYIGETHLVEKKPGEPFLLNLGADRDVKVKREKLKDKVKETYFGAIQRDTTVREFTYKITAENIKNKPARLKIVDSIPVSKTDKIEVKDVKIIPSPKEKAYKDKEGVMLWMFEMAPGEKREILMDFIVTYPAASPPFGL